MKVLLALAGVVLGVLAARRAAGSSATGPWHEATAPGPAQAPAPADDRPGT